MKHYRVKSALDSYVHTQDGVRYEFTKGLVVKESASCDPDNGVASLDRNPPLVRKEFIARFPDIFEPIEEDNGS